MIESPLRWLLYPQQGRVSTSSVLPSRYAGKQNTRLTAYSTPLRPLIPEQSGHPFQSKADTHSNGKRPPLGGPVGTSCDAG